MLGYRGPYTRTLIGVAPMINRLSPYGRHRKLTFTNEVILESSDDVVKFLNTLVALLLSRYFMNCLSLLESLSYAMHKVRIHCILMNRFMHTLYSDEQVYAYIVF